MRAVAVGGPAAVVVSRFGGIGRDHNRGLVSDLGGAGFVLKIPVADTALVIRGVAGSNTGGGLSRNEHGIMVAEIAGHDVCCGAEGAGKQGAFLLHAGGGGNGSPVIPRMRPGLRLFIGGTPRVCAGTGVRTVAVIRPAAPSVARGFEHRGLFVAAEGADLHGQAVGSAGGGVGAGLVHSVIVRLGAVEMAVVINTEHVMIDVVHGLVIGEIVRVFIDLRGRMAGSPVLTGGAEFTLRKASGGTGSRNCFMRFQRFRRVVRRDRGIRFLNRHGLAAGALTGLRAVGNAGTVMI